MLELLARHHLARGRRLPDQEVLGHRQPGEDVPSLGHVGDSTAGALPSRERGDVLSVQEHRARADGQLTHQASQEGGLSHAVPPQHGRAGAGGDFKIDPAQRVASAVEMVESVDGEHQRPR